MAVEVVKYEMDVPKEGKEIADALYQVVRHFVEKKGLAEAAALLPHLMEAVDNAGSVLDEMKSQYKDEMAAYMVHKMWEALEKPKADPAPAPAPEAPAQ